ncbi:MAG TPA: energy transducer TonB, partial [Kofleriaceae bacterium]|nr:energy transducer TonB [Kofleriaceae bacterium]
IAPAPLGAGADAGAPASAEHGSAAGAGDGGHGPAGPASPTGPYAAGDVDAQPRLVGDVRPAYPAAAERLGLEGEVVLALVVDAGGRVTDVHVVKGAGHGFDEAALAVARQLRFVPGRKRGAAVAVRVTWTCRFRLEE